VAGRKRPSVELCIVIERASKGVVRCESLRPDVDWAYLARRRIRQ
jgi:DNA-binding transcriptional regulator YdaS (Cro superfamily)